MTISLCDWCGEPAKEGQQLCASCLLAQAHATERDLDEKALLEKADDVGSKLAHATKASFLAIFKGIGYLLFGTIMIIAGLGGSCSLLGVFAVFVSPAAGLYSLVCAGIGFGMAYLMYKLIMEMQKIGIKPLERSDKTLPDLPKSLYNRDKTTDSQNASLGLANPDTNEAGATASERQSNIELVEPEAQNGADGEGKEGKDSPESDEQEKDSSP